MGLFFDRPKLGSTAAWLTDQNKGRYREKELLLLLVSLTVSITEVWKGLNDRFLLGCHWIGFSSPLLNFWHGIVHSSALFIVFFCTRSVNSTTGVVLMLKKTSFHGWHFATLLHCSGLDVMNLKLTNWSIFIALNEPNQMCAVDLKSQGSYFLMT